MSLEETKKTPTKAQNRTNTPPTSGKKGNSSTHKTTPGAGDNNSLSETGNRDGDNTEALDDSIDDVTGQSDRMVNLIVKKLLIDQM